MRESKASPLEDLPEPVLVPMNSKSCTGAVHSATCTGEAGGLPSNRAPSGGASVGGLSARLRAERLSSGGRGLNMSCGCAKSSGDAGRLGVEGGIELALS